MEQNTEKAAPAVEPKKKGKRAKATGKKRTVARKLAKKSGTVRKPPLQCSEKGPRSPHL